MINSILANGKYDNGRAWRGVLYRSLPILTFVIGFILCCLITYSDGDDAFFLQTVQNHPGFLDFVSYLTGTMNGRITTTASLWLVFSTPIWVWRILNACMMSVYAIFLAKYAQIICGHDSDKPMGRFVICAGFAIMGVAVFGYSCLWVTGSVNYLWPCVTMLISLYPFVKLEFTGEKSSFGMWLLSAVMGIYTCLAQEQFAAVLLAFCAILILCRYSKEKRIEATQIICFCLFCIAFLLLLLSPANAARAAKEVDRWLPDYAQLHFEGKVFITLQWVAHSISHGLKWVFTLLWAAMAMLFIQKKKWIWAVLGCVFSVISVLSVGIDAVTDVGLNNIDMSKKILHAPQFVDLTVLQIFFMIFWLIAAVVTAIMIFSAFHSKKQKYAGILLYLAAMASMLVMFFSPTIYASGERSLFCSAVLLVLLCACLLGKQDTFRKTALKFGLICGVAMFQLADNFAYLIKMIS